MNGFCKEFGSKAWNPYRICPESFKDLYACVRDFKESHVRVQYCFLIVRFAYDSTVCINFKIWEFFNQFILRI